MKFGREYRQLLKDEEFPEHWRNKTINYWQLKKVIKKIEKELEDVGLDVDTVRTLSKPADDATIEITEQSQDPSGSALGAVTRLSRLPPSLWIAIDKASGQPVDATLTKETKQCLFALGKVQPGEAKSNLESTNHLDQITLSRDFDALMSDVSETEDPAERYYEQHRWLKVPLRSVVDFFAILNPELARVEAVKAAESAAMERAISSLGTEVTQLTMPTTTQSRKPKANPDLSTWRKIFALYIDCAIFFPTYGHFYSARKFDEAYARMQMFSDQLREQRLVDKLKVQQSRDAVNNFNDINTSILKTLRFLELNATAASKILKKFDKRTALGANRAFPDADPAPFARAMVTMLCAEVDSKIVTRVPRFDEWQCPICYDLAWRPIRLGCCNNIFCIRCIIRLQQEAKDQCPMCRQSTVRAADSAYIDANTVTFLEKYFPDEVKSKDRANKRQAGIDQYGEAFYQKSCVVM
ncbi:hypothetical protein LTR66_014328 [Elasticomyces elasticus]|nr:hypothetical protein LTR66_014328 [Elasticomyces elasticus]